MKYQLWVTPEEIAYNAPYDFESFRTHTLPKGIGPHQGKEINLMLAGYKPVAILPILKYWRPEDLAILYTFIDEGKLIYRQIHEEWDVIAVPGQEWRIDRMDKIITARDNGTNRISIYHIKIGRLLGYTKDQIRFFLSRQ
jgi:hypothetical protein